jgi:hypothetical protein
MDVWTVIDTFYVKPELATATKPSGLVVFVRGLSTKAKTLSGRLSVTGPGGELQVFVIKVALHEFDDVSSIVLDAPATAKVSVGSTVAVSNEER